MNVGKSDLGKVTDILFQKRLQKVSLKSLHLYNKPIKNVNDYIFTSDNNLCNVIVIKDKYSLEEMDVSEKNGAWDFGAVVSGINEPTHNNISTIKVTYHVKSVTEPIVEENRTFNIPRMDRKGITIPISFKAKKIYSVSPYVLKKSMLPISSIYSHICLNIFIPPIMILSINFKTVVSPKNEFRFLCR